MVRTRLAAAFLVLGVTALGLACEFAVPNGQYCTKDRDCVSNQCVQQICTEIGSSQQIENLDANTGDESGDGSAAESATDANDASDAGPTSDAAADG